MFFPPIVASGGPEAVQKRPGTTYFERNCETTVPESGGPGVTNTIADRERERERERDRPPIPGIFGNGISDRNIGPPHTDTQSKRETEYMYENCNKNGEKEKKKFLLGEKKDRVMVRNGR